MSVRRLLVNFGSSTTDFRVGLNAAGELPGLLKHVVGAPKRALVVNDGMASTELRRELRRALIDNGFAVESLSVAERDSVRDLATAELVFAKLAEHGLTSDDLIVALGDTDVCSVVAFCAKMWRGGMSSVAVACTLEAMCTVATSMRALDVAGVEDALTLTPGWDMVVCDLDLVVGADIDALGAGYVQLLTSAFSQSRRIWEQFAEKIEGMVSKDAVAFADALCNAQSARSSAIRSANPSARSAYLFGHTTACALRACLGDGVPWYRLLAEGIRFESRLAHDVCNLDVDTIFEIDDRLEDLGIEELAFDLEPARFCEAIKAERFARSNRLMLSLPRFPGAIRLCAIDSELLERHAEAFLASRRELACDE